MLQLAKSPQNRTFLSQKGLFFIRKGRHTSNTIWSDFRKRIFSGLKFGFAFIICTFILSFNVNAQYNINAGSTNYTQDFNTLTNGTWTDNTTLTGWYARTDATASITAYGANTGSTTTAGLYAFGVAGVNPLSDRALGYSPSNAFTGAAGTGKGYVGWRLRNNTGSTVTSITITWTGEQWRRENNTNAHTLNLEYQTGTTVTSLTGGTWTSASSVFTSPITGTSALALDGNAAANRTANISVTITVTINAGDEIMIRWSDLNDSGNDHYMAIDDVTVNASTGGVTPPDIALSNNGTQVVAANVNQGTTAHVLHKFCLAVTTANASFTGLTCTTAGTYAVSDITNLKVRYSTDATLDAGDATLSTITPTVAGSQTFSSFTPQTINSGSTGYIFITADIAANATHNNTISVNAITTTNLTFTSGNKTGSTTDGGTQTIKDVTAPAVSSFNPADEATGVATTANLVITFNENMQLGTAGTVIIYNSDATVFESIPYNDARITFSTNTVTIDPTGTFVNGSSYYVQISGTAMRDAAGNNYAGISDATTWNFSVGASATGCATDLIISEYVEGSGSNKYIEIYNNTGVSVDLSDYRLQLYANGSSSATNDVTLSGTLANNSVIVYKNSSATIYGGAATNNAAVNFNGDDAVVLYKTSTSSYVDIIGRIGEDPGTAWTSTPFTTLDKTLVRNANITAGITTNPAGGFPTLSTEWTQYNVDDVSHLGSHTMTCGPTITTSVTSLSGFVTNYGVASASQNYTVSGDLLTANVLVTAPTNWEVSTDNTNFYPSVTLNQSGGNLTGEPVTVYVRINNTAPTGLVDGNIIHSSTGATNKVVALTGTVLKPEATNHATNFSCDTDDYSSITLSWTDATGTTLPDAYLIKWSSVSLAAITNPVDGTFEADGAGRMNINQTVQTGVATGLSASTTYYFKIFPYTNSGTNVNYKTTATVPNTYCTTSSGPCLTEDFVSEALPTGWTSSGVSWTESPGAASFNATTGELATILVANPASLTFDLTRTTNTTAKTFYVEISTTTQGGTYTTVATYDHSNTTSGGTTTCTVDLSAYSSYATTYIKFRKASSTTSPWRLDNINVLCESCSVPATQSSAIVFSAIDGNSMTVSWTNGTGTKRILKMNTSNSFTAPINGTDPIASSVYAGAGEQVMYNGTGNSISISGLNPSTTYWFHVYDYKCAGINTYYNITDATGNPNSQATIACIAPTTQASNITFSAIASTYMTVNWTNGNGTRRVVIMNTSNTFTNPTNGTDPVANPAYGGSGQQVVYNGTGSSVSVTGLTLSTTYWFRVYEYNCTGSNTVFYNVTATGNPNSQATTSSDPTVLLPGDMIFVGYDSKADPACSGATDKFYIANIVDINPGTSFLVVNSRFESGAPAGTKTNRWYSGGDDIYDDPGYIVFTWNGASVLSAGSIFSFMVNASVTDMQINGVNTTDFTVGGNPSTCNINSTKPDQIFIMQGTFIPYGVVGTSRYNLFNGSVLFGLTNGAAWVPLSSSVPDGTASADRASRLPGDLNCFNIDGSVGSVDGCKFYLNSSPHTGSKKAILSAIMTAGNWTIPTNTNCLNVPEDFSSPYTGTSCGQPFIVNESVTDGTWTGAVDDNWFNCKNWEGLAVPGQKLDVTIPGSSTNDCDVDETEAADFGGFAKCKNLTVSGRKITLEGNANDQIHIYGNLLINATGLIDMDDSNNSTTDGIIYLYGSWNNTLTTSAFLEGNGTVNFYSTPSKTISNSETFYNMIIQGGDVTLGANIYATNNLTMTQGLLNTGSYNVDLGSTGSIIETPINPSSYVLGNLKVTRNIGGGVNQTFGGIGLEINDACALNSTTVTRVTGTQLHGNNPCCYTNLSIKRYFDIVPTTNSGFNATMKFNYFDVEMMSVSEANLYFYKAELPFVSDTWIQQDDPASRDLTNNFLTLSNIPDFSRWTVASLTAPLPIELLYFNASYKGKLVNLNWSTASELNNDFFTVEHSPDAKSFSTVTTIKGAGNSVRKINYSALDPYPFKGVSYYRLKQTDFNGLFTYSNIVSVDVDENNCDFSISAIYVQGNTLKVQLNCLHSKVTMDITDISGKILLTQISNSTDDTQLISISLPALMKGIYIFRATTDKDVIVKKFYL